MRYSLLILSLTWCTSSWCTQYRYCHASIWGVLDTDFLQIGLSDMTAGFRLLHVSYFPISSYSFKSELYFIDTYVEGFFYVDTILSHGWSICKYVCLQCICYAYICGCMRVCLIFISLPVPWSTLLWPAAIVCFLIWRLDAVTTSILITYISYLIWGLAPRNIEMWLGCSPFEISGA